MITFTLDVPVTVGDIVNPTIVKTLQLTSFQWSSIPRVAPTGTGVLSLTLTDPVSGYQMTISYQDSSALSFWNDSVPKQESGVLADIISCAVFQKLIADCKLPNGTVGEPSSQSLQGGI